jgi:hypothetical protein
MDTVWANNVGMRLRSRHWSRHEGKAAQSTYQGRRLAEIRTMLSADTEPDNTGPFVKALLVVVDTGLGGEREVNMA